jgi:glycosyltransferase involved in cell wall biosynthesis
LDSERLRTLIAGRPASDRIFWHGPWNAGHNNPRTARIVPRLSRLDRYPYRMSDRRVVRGLQYRAWHKLKTPRERLVLGAAASRRYRYMLTTDPAQIRHFAGKVVVDLDEPTWTPEGVAPLNAPNVEAVVLLTERNGRRLEELGLEKPWHVLPGGVDRSHLTQEAIDEVAQKHRQNGELVVGHISAWFLTKNDRTYNWTSDLDHMLELWDGIRTGSPHARLWLIGNASQRARAACAERDDVELFDSIPFGGALPYIANFDIALYPRTGPEMGVPVKLFEYMGVGAPIVSYDVGSTQIVRESEAGLMAGDAREFVAAARQLAGDEEARRRFGRAGLEAAAELEWDRVIERYEREVLDRYLP